MFWPEEADIKERPHHFPGVKAKKAQLKYVNGRGKAEEGESLLFFTQTHSREMES